MNDAWRIVAEQVKKPEKLDKLPSQIERIIKTQMKRDIAELLQLDREALESFFTSLFSDSKVWLGLCAFISGVVLNQTQITIGGALGALSLIGANAFKAAADRRQKLKNNDYALVYRVVSKKKQFEINEFDPSFYPLNI